VACASPDAALPFVETDRRRPALGFVDNTLSWTTRFRGQRAAEVNAMAWTTPTLVEICIGLEINGYLPAEF
jgi:coenzyme PQQ precursor peptide PqqA